MPTTPTLAVTLSPLDWAAVAGYGLVLVLTGLWLNRKQNKTEDYFLAGRSMPGWAVAVSVLATSLSAATFLGGPEQAYRGDLRYLSASLGGIIAALIVAWLFLPAFYAQGVITVYQLLQRRFGHAAQTAASAMFMLGRLFASGARIYIAAHALAFVALGGIELHNLMLASIILAAVGVAYTVTGGIATVIWTDVVQTIIFIGAVIVAASVLFVRVMDQTGGLSPAIHALRSSNKLTALSISLNPSQTYTLWTALIGFAILNLAAFGTDQDLAQRLLTCKSRAHAAGAMIGSVIVGIPVTALFMSIGLLLFLYEPTNPATLGKTHGVQAMLSFMTSDVPTGVAGLLIAGLFAAGLSSLDSALNALASTFVNDLYRPRHPAATDKHLLRISRIAVVSWGAALGIVACACAWWQSTSNATLLDFALAVMTFAYAPLAAVFLCALLTKRGTSTTAIAGLATGLVLTVAMEILNQQLNPIHQIAFPWRLTIATACSFAVCASRRSIINSQPNSPNE